MNNISQKISEMEEIVDAIRKDKDQYESMTEEQLNLIIKCKEEVHSIKQIIDNMKYDNGNLIKNKEVIIKERQKLIDKYKELVREYPVIDDNLEFKELSVEDAEAEL